MASKEISSCSETLLSGDGQISFCSKNSIAWCWLQVMEGHLLLWGVTSAGLVTFQPHAQVAYSKSSRGCLLFVKCWQHKGHQKRLEQHMSCWITEILVRKTFEKDNFFFLGPNNFPKKKKVQFSFRNAPVFTF